MTEQIIRLEGKSRVYAFGVSNIGVFEGNISNHVKLNRIIPSQSSGVGGSAYQFILASVKGGEMTIALTWQENIVDWQRLAEKVLYNLENQLYRFAYPQLNSKSLARL